MRSVISVTFILLTSICLLSAELVSSYNLDNNTVLEVVDTSEENPTEDNENSELELELNIIDKSNFDISYIDQSNGILCYQMILHPIHFKDIPIPPPDFF